MQNLIGKQIDDYQIIEQIGQGGMAVIYRAVQGSLGREVALKVLSSRLTYDPEFIERFRREALAAARLNHPSIVTIYNVGEQNGIHYIAMKLLKGESLDKIVQRGRLSVAQVVPIIQRVAEALDHAHGQGIVHRDIKPANVIINASGWPTLTDFGIAKAIADNKPGLTQKGMIIGTPHYMAPEQIQGFRVDYRADIYALGVMCYEMLAGSLPFQGDTASVMYAQLNVPPPPLRQLMPDVPYHVEVAINRALAKRAEERFQRVSEFAAALATPSTATPSGDATAQVAHPSNAPTQIVNPPSHSSAHTYPQQPPTPPSATSSTSQSVPRALIVLVIFLALALTGTLGFLFAWYLNQTPDDKTAIGQNPNGIPVEVVTSHTPTADIPFLDPTSTPIAPTIPAPASPTNPAPSATLTATTPASPTASPTNTPSATATATAEAEVELVLTQTALLNRLTIRTNSEPVFSYRTNSPPIIDGDLSEWANEPFTEAETVVFRAQNRTNASDLSLSFATQWDSSHLYLAVRVRDDTLVQIERGEGIFQGDSLELIIDAELASDFSDGRLSADDYQLGVLPGEVFERSSEVYRWFPRQQAGALSNPRVSSQRTSDGYEVELQLPWREFGITPQAETAYGFNLGANDNDSPATAEQQSLLSLSPVRKLTDPRTWGTLVLMRQR